MLNYKQEPETSSTDFFSSILNRKRKQIINLKERGDFNFADTGEKISDRINGKLSNRGRNIWKKIALGGIVLIFVALIATTSYFYVQWKKVKSNPQASSQEEIASIKKKIGNFIELPPSEEPTMATVTDVEKLKNQPFFSKAQNGDKVLIYTNSQKAILYRPSTGKIVDMMSLGAIGTAPAQNLE